MRVRVRRGLWLLATLAACAGVFAFVAGATFPPSAVSPPLVRPPSCEGAIRELRPGWAIRAICRFPDPVNALALPPRDGRIPHDNVYVGTINAGGVFRFNVLGDGIFTTIHQGTGDVKQFGDSRVSRLAFRDLDGDGTTELIASTSQVTPRGRPRLYVWSFEGPTPILRGLARPEIRSSWSHGLGFLPRGDGEGESVFATFCGCGEIVEYQLKRGGEESGFCRDGLAWKQVGQLPASGEWTETADIDNDGRDDLCFAVGYGERAAAIHAYQSDAPGAALRLGHAIDEGGRFGNVRFVVANGRGDGKNDVIAWWSTDHLYGGDCEIIRYRLDTGGVTERTVIARGEAGTLWPDDGQIAVLDSDGDFRPEVWFGVKSGNLWRYDPAGTAPPERILKIEPPLGPIVGGITDGTGRPTLFLGWGRDVLRLDRVASEGGSPILEPPPGKSLSAAANRGIHPD